MRGSVIGFIYTKENFSGNALLTLRILESGISVKEAEGVGAEAEGCLA